MTRVHSDADGVSVPTVADQTPAVSARTPGQGRGWAASASPHGYGAHEGVTVTDNRGLVVAVAIGDVPELDATATARLIAAAPDYDAAARKMVDALGCAPDEVIAGAFGDDVLDALVGLRAAIAKATGASA